MTCKEKKALKQTLGYSSFQSSQLDVPISDQELYKKIGIDPPCGVMLYDPSSTGKTMHVKAIAYHITAAFIMVVSSEFVQKYLGEAARCTKAPAMHEDWGRDRQQVSTVYRLQLLLHFCKSLFPRLEPRPLHLLLGERKGIASRKGEIHISKSIHFSGIHYARQYISEQQILETSIPEKEKQQVETKLLWTFVASDVWVMFLTIKNHSISYED